MAETLWGKVYYQDDIYAGELRQEPGGRHVFTYDTSYLERDTPAIAFTLPKQSQPHLSEWGLHPFFDNLVAEGWLRNAQARALKTDPGNRFALLLAFGRDCAGAISVIDPMPTAEPVIDLGDPQVAAALAARASLSGIQPKVLVVQEGRRFRPARRDEKSTHIAKLPSGALRDIVANEYVTLAAAAALLPDDEVVETVVAPLGGIAEQALIVRRFDRLSSGTKVHFEEFNQLLGRRSGDDKYNATYEDIARFIRTTPRCLPAEAFKLYRRILVCFLTGNTDAHLKNFAMLHTLDGLRLTPAYDLVATALYPEYQTLALSVAGATHLAVGDVKPKHLIALGEACGLSAAAIAAVVLAIDRRRKPAAAAIQKAAGKVGAIALGNDLVHFMERRWNGSFASTGQLLSKKRSGDAKN